MPYALALAVMLACTALSFCVHPFATLEDLTMIHLLGIVLIAMRASVRVSMSAAIAGILAFDYFFIPPALVFAWADAKNSLTFALMLIVAAVISRLNQRLRDQKQLARELAFRAETLYALKVELARGTDPKQLAAATRRHLERLFGGRVVILLGAPASGVDNLSEADIERARRAWNGRELVSADENGSSVWAPLVGIGEPVGVIGVALPEPFNADSKLGQLLFACAVELATTIERAQLAEAAHQSQLQAEAERLRSSLLSAVSHDLKTPLSSILAAGTTLLERQDDLDRSSRDELLATIVSESDRLTRLIQNLLSVSRLDSPAVEIRRTPEAIDEIVSAALELLAPRLSRPRVHLDIAPDLPLVCAEPGLIGQVMTNLFDNALRYAGSGCRLYVRARAADSEISVHVADDGPGIVADEREKVFEKFYRGRSAGKNDGGMGLGLTICRAILRVHGGSISVRERAGGGALVEFTLPVFSERAPSVPSSAIGVRP
ncbi:MAG TPA: ATP-binding protein [Polyangiaceae bacterium]